MYEERVEGRRETIRDKKGGECSNLEFILYLLGVLHGKSFSQLLLSFFSTFSQVFSGFLKSRSIVSEFVVVIIETIKLFYKVSSF